MRNSIVSSPTDRDTDHDLGIPGPFLRRPSIRTELPTLGPQTVNVSPLWLTWFVIGLGLPLLSLNGWLLVMIVQALQPLPSIFITALLAAFVLDYPVRWMVRRRVRRSWAIAIVCIITLILLVSLGIVLMPIALAQLAELIQSLPSWMGSAEQQLTKAQSWFQGRHWVIDLSRLLPRLLESLSSQAQSIGGTVLDVGLRAISQMVDLLFSAVLTVYLLLHGPQLWDSLFDRLPGNLLRLRQALRQSFRSYFVGQASIALLKGLAMTIAFLLLRLPFGLLFGSTIGVLSLVPFGCPLGIAIVSLLLLLNDIKLGLTVMVVGGAIEQIIENFVTPKLLGDATGLNPILILASVLLGAKLGGVLGVILAVPLATCLNLLLAKPDAVDPDKAGPDKADPNKADLDKTASNEAIVNS
jgi:predicted PurR-regulated permease PerM